VSLVSSSPGAIVRAADERWQTAWLTAIDPTPAAHLARASKSLKVVYGLPVPTDERLRAIAELSIARLHLTRAQAALHDPKRKRQAWLHSDIGRAADSVDALAKRAARGQR